MRITCVRNLRPAELSEGMAVFVPAAENPSYYVAATVGKVVDRNGSRTFSVTPRVGAEVSLTFARKQVESGIGTEPVFIEGDPSDIDSAAVKVIDVQGFRFSVTFDVEGADLEAARQKFDLAMISAGLEPSENGVEAYGDLPGTTPVVAAKPEPAPAKVVPSKAAKATKAAAPAAEKAGAVDLAAPVAQADVAEPTEGGPAWSSTAA